MVLTEEEKKERKRISQKKYRENNKEKIKKISENYRQTLKSIDPDYKKKWYKTQNGKKSFCKSNWKIRGLNMENFEEIYERYTMAIFCDICECVLDGIGNNRKCMDHSHKTGEFRNVVCHYCNVTVCGRRGE